MTDLTTESGDNTMMMRGPNNNTLPLIHAPNDQTLLDMSIPLIYAPLKGDKGDKGDQGERGLPGRNGSQGPQGLRGQDGFIPPTLSNAITVPWLQHQVSFYFKIIDGKIRLPITNSPDRSSIQEINPYNIMFNKSGFVVVKVKLLKPDNNNVLLIQYPGTMLDCSNSRCINLEWIGPINQGQKLILSGAIDINTNGYWYITYI